MRRPVWRPTDQPFIEYVSAELDSFGEYQGYFRVLDWEIRKREMDRLKGMRSHPSYGLEEE